MLRSINTRPISSVVKSEIITHHQAMEVYIMACYEGNKSTPLKFKIGPKSQPKPQPDNIIIKRKKCCKKLPLHLDCINREVKMRKSKMLRKRETDCHNAFLAQLNLVKGMCSKLLHGTDGRGLGSKPIMAAAPPNSVQCFGRKKTAVAVTQRCPNRACSA
ncbi:hypothetical protein LXL04_027882 [Taraxacum kok-saghyz]